MSKELQDKLISQVKILNETIWEGKANEQSIKRWLSNFGDSPIDESEEKLCALYLLSRFTYLGSREIKESLRSLYRDLVVYPIISSLRRSLNNTSDLNVLSQRLQDELNAIKFLGAGNPSESGAHLLYYFRQENRLNKKAFVHALEAFKLLEKSNSATVPNGKETNSVNRFVFIDDFCGTGTQAVRYAGNVVSELRTRSPDCLIEYYVLAGTSTGLDYVRKNAGFNRVDCVIELDNSFKCFESDSRYFDNNDEKGRLKSKELCSNFGSIINPRHPLGHENSQLLVAFSHNTPNNTLPIFWAENDNNKWNAIFRRYPKSLAPNLDI
jgi:hypothetical protein